MRGEEEVVGGAKGGTAARPPSRSPERGRAEAPLCHLEGGEEGGGERSREGGRGGSEGSE